MYKFTILNWPHLYILGQLGLNKIGMYIFLYMQKKINKNNIDYILHHSYLQMKIL